MRMTLRETAECFFGRKSHINYAGQVVFCPLLLWLTVCLWTLDTLFSRDR